jgi:hypothetical protein
VIISRIFPVSIAKHGGEYSGCVFPFILERKMKQTQNVLQSTDTASTKPEQIINNANGTSFEVFPQGIGNESTPIIREFSGQNGKGTMIEQVVNTANGGSDVLIADPKVLAQIGAIGEAFGAGNVGGELKSMDIQFSGPNGTGNVTSGTAVTTDGETYQFKTAGLPSGELVSVQEFTGPGVSGRVEQIINVFSNGSIQFNMIGGSELGSQGISAMQENFNSSGNLASVRTQLSNGNVIVELLNYNASGQEVSQTVDTFNAQNKVVSSVTSAPSGPTPPQIGGPAAIQALVSALSSLSPQLPGTGVAAVPIQPPKVTLASSAH